MPPEKPTKQASLWTFLGPSLIGVCCFMIPFQRQGEYRIALAHLSKGWCTLLHRQMPYGIASVLLMAALGSCLATWGHPKAVRHTPLVATRWQLIVRLLSAAMAWFMLAKPLHALSQVGHVILHSLLPILLANLFFASFLAPLLFQFGLLEFIGGLMAPLMRCLFRLPGRAAIPCIASWLGDGTVGTMMTLREYEKGHYTERESSTIIAGFAAVSITFYATILEQVGLERYFLSFCLTVWTSSFVAALILSRIPPLSWKRDRYITPKAPEAPRPQATSLWQASLDAARKRAATAPTIDVLIKRALHNILDIAINVLPNVLVVSMTGLLLAEHTPCFTYIGKPFIPLLHKLHIAEAPQAAAALFIGFIDMMIPTLLAAKICVPATRFVVAALSVTQIIYLAELGAFLLSKKERILGFIDLLVIFLLRTAITLPIIALAATYLF